MEYLVSTLQKNYTKNHIFLTKGYKILYFTNNLETINKQNKGKTIDVKSHSAKIIQNLIYFVPGLDIKISIFI